MRLSVQITSNLFGTLLSRVQRGGTAAVEVTAEEIRAEAARRSRVLTGAMRDGWQVTKTGAARATVSNDVPHTIFNEYGTVHMPAQPMLTPAIDSATPRLLARVAAVVVL